MVDEIGDRYGPLPGELLLLADQMGVKAAARRLAATALELTRTRVALALAPTTPVDPTRLPPSWKLTPDGRLVHAMTAAEARAPAEAARRHLQALADRAT